MNAKRIVALGISAMLVILYLVGNLAFKGGATTDIGMYREETYRAGGLDRIAILEIEGTILDQASQGFLTQSTYNHRQFLTLLEHAFENKNIKAIVLRVNTPGGGVAESDEIFYRILELKEKHDKPIYAYMANQATSGGYYVSAAADHIVANRTTLTGSIGVIMQSFNMEELAENIGVKDVTFTSGPYKDLLNPFRSTSQTEAEILQGIVDEYYNQFVDVIVEGRGMDRNAVLELADGRIYTGQQAFNVGLVDSVGFLDDAIDAVAEAANVTNPTIIRYKLNPWAAFSTTYTANAHFLQWLLPFSPMRVLEQPNRPIAMYIYE